LQGQYGEVHAPQCSQAWVRSLQDPGTRKLPGSNGISTTTTVVSVRGSSFDLGRISLDRKTLGQTGTLKDAKQPWKTMFAIAAMTGLRPGELLGLTLDDLDLGRQQIRVRRSASFGRLIAPKTRQSESNVPVPVALGELLAEWLP